MAAGYLGLREHERAQRPVTHHRVVMERLSAKIRKEVVRDTFIPLVSFSAKMPQHKHHRVCGGVVVVFLVFITSFFPVAFTSDLLHASQILPQNHCVCVLYGCFKVCLADTAAYLKRIVSTYL